MPRAASSQQCSLAFSIEILLSEWHHVIGFRCFAYVGAIHALAVEGIARTIIHDPPVLIFDEPTSGLDVLVARNVIDEIKSLRDQGKCIIFSTHIMREVEKLCHRIAIIYRGRILAMGSVKELADQYHESDMEELFFKLIDLHEDELTQSLT
jgi:ABC-type Na+ transport system ATPase subunit NatA